MEGAEPGRGDVPTSQCRDCQGDDGDGPRPAREGAADSDHDGKEMMEMVLGCGGECGTTGERKVEEGLLQRSLT